MTITAVIGLPYAGRPAGSSTPRFDGYSAAAAASALDVRLLDRSLVLAAGATGASVDSRPAAPHRHAAESRAAGLRAELLSTALLPWAQARSPGGPARTVQGLGPFPVAGLAGVGALRGEADSVWTPEACVLGQSIGQGEGEVTDLELVNPGPRPLAAAASAWSRSATFLEPLADGGYAVVSEARIRLAPVTLLRGTSDELTVDVLGEWRLRATSTGRAGGMSVSYGPADASPATPVLRLRFRKTDFRVTLQDLLGPQGVPLPPGLPVDLTIGRPPDPAAPTTAAATVDVVRVRIPATTSGLSHVAEVRIGHLEVSAAAPTQGIACRLPVRKTVDRDPAGPGDEFRWTISIPSSAGALAGTACELTSIRAVDTARPGPGVRFRLLAASAGGQIDGPTVRWDRLPDYHPGDPPITLTIDGLVDLASARGRIANILEVTAAVDRCPAAGAQTRTGPIPLHGQFNLP
jgi:hypothetical protein